MQTLVFQCTSQCATMTLAFTGVLGFLTLSLVPALAFISPRAPSLVAGHGAAKTLEVNDGKFRYQSVGTGNEAVLFLHGFNNQLSAWDETWRLLDGNCGRRIRLDIPGYGGSTWLADSYSLPAQAERVIAFMNVMGLARVTLVGVSMGGSLSAWLAAHYPERVKGLVLLAPSGFPGSLRYGGLFGKLLEPGWPNRIATWVAESSLYRRLFPRSTALQALTVTASYGGPWEKALKRIKMHTWVLWSRGDFGVSFSHAEDVAKSIPESTLLRLSPEVGHDIPANRPELIAKIACLAHQETPRAPLPSELKKLLARNGDL